MAENQEDRSSDDLSDEASTYRIEESRRKGQVFQSRDLSAIAAFVAVSAMAYGMAPSMGGTLIEYMRESFKTDSMSKLDLATSGMLGMTLGKALKIGGAIILPITLAGFLVGGISSFAQIGSIFSTDPLTPDFSRINPVSGLKRLFSKKHMMDSLVIIFKSSVVLFAVVQTVKNYVAQSPGYLAIEAGSQVEVLGHMAKGIAVPVVFILLVFGIVDYAINRSDYMKQHRLTKQEQKEEYKEKEGDPKIKARIRAVQREVARRRMMAAVKRADVIVTNPTHIAVAIMYDRDKMMAPRVVAKGADFVAQKIKKIAAEAGVPMVENVPLARTLYKTVKIGQFVPRALYQAIAEVLAYVYKLRGRV